MPSRVARETSRYFDASSTPVLPRRSTRVSLARFAYNGANGSSTPSTPVKNEDVKVEIGSDIEDAVQTPATRKRKRAETVTQSTPRRTSTRSSTRIKAEIKTEVKTEVKTESDAEDVKPETTPLARGRARKPARRTTDPTTGTTTIEPPSDWEEIYSLVKEMRLHGPAAKAAVDTMGCERLARPDASARDRRFQTLVALMLSSQTKDTVNAEAMARLHRELPPHRPGAPAGLNLENMLAVDAGVLNGLIGKVGFHNNKTKYLKQTALLLQSHFNSDIPPTIPLLTSLPGVGPKMAHLCMSAPNGWNRVEGIGVDVHVHRITNLWGWQGTPPTKTPEETRKALESWLPRDKWREINWLLVGFGQTVCLPVGRKCGDCELGLRGLCRAAERGKVIAGRRRRELGVKKEEGGGEGEVRVKEEETVIEDGEEVVENGEEVVKEEKGMVKKEEGVVEEGDAAVKTEETSQGLEGDEEGDSDVKVKVKREEGAVDDGGVFESVEMDVDSEGLKDETLLKKEGPKEDLVKEESVVKQEANGVRIKEVEEMEVEEKKEMDVAVNGAVKTPLEGLDSPPRVKMEVMDK